MTEVRAWEHISLTPGMQQFKEVKLQHPDCILFFRMGDFYEMFFEDAEVAAKVLGITLTKRAGVPLAGVPHYTGEENISKMVMAGYKVAVCEQLEDPRQVKNRVVKRGVVRIVTPGTITSPESLDAKSNNFIVSLLYTKTSKTTYNSTNNFGFSCADLTTGIFRVAQLSAKELLQECARLKPAEIVCTARDAEFLAQTNKDFFGSFCVSIVDDRYFHYPLCYKRLVVHFAVDNLSGFGIEGNGAGDRGGEDVLVQASGGLLSYLYDTQKGRIGQMRKLQLYNPRNYLSLDRSTLRNLELFENIRDNSSRSSLFSIIDRTVTSMGGRLLRQWLRYPLLERAAIEQRLDAVQELVQNSLVREDLLNLLEKVYDIERLIGKVNAGTAHPKDTIALRDSLAVIPQLLDCLRKVHTRLFQELKDIDPLPELRERIAAALKDDPPTRITEGDIIRDGYSKELDELRDLMRHGKKFIAELEMKERERTGIQTLKVGFNRVHGYYIDITRRFSDKIPSDYIRKQTLASSERYVTPALKDMEEKILGAEEKVLVLESRLFTELVQHIAEHTEEMQTIASVVAQLDSIASLATVAATQDYVRPELHDGYELILEDSRHPVVEQLQAEPFVPNSIRITPESRLLIITGPNMAGKCLVGGSFIYTKKGMLSLESFKPSTIQRGEFKPLSVTVCGRAGPENTSHFYYDGKRKTIRVKTSFGYEIEGTYNHPILARTSQGDEIWKKLEDLRYDDKIIINRKINVWGSSRKIPSHLLQDFCPHHNVKMWNIPSRIDPDLAYVLGLLIGDGTLTYKNSIVFSNCAAALIHSFKKIITQKFGYPVKTKKNKKDHYVTSRHIRYFFEKLGLEYVGAVHKRIPEIILKAPKKIVRSFMRGLFDTDGTAENRYGNVRFSTSSPVLAQQVQCILLNFGIIASLKPKKTKVHTNYIVSINGENAILFHKRIGFGLARKRQRSSLASSLRMPNYGIPYLSQILKIIQKRIVLKKNKVLALKRVKNINSIFYTYLPTGRNISYSKLRELIKYCDLNGINCDELKIISSNFYCYDSIASVVKSQTAKDVYDFSIPKTHSFVANGFVNHNSTFMRQLALIQILAQVGSFVPARSARLGIVDAVFTRVGAYDDLTMGQSTFMVEMTETAYILHNATARSLIIMDEIGRGTSTFDGIALAWAIGEELYRAGAKTLFATHYHQLNKLAEEFEGVKNYTVAVKEKDDEVIFLRKIIAGSTDKSYGIYVGKLAGLPQNVIDRSRKIMSMLEMEDEIASRLHAPLKKEKEKPLIIEDIHLESKVVTKSQMNSNSSGNSSEDASLEKFM